MEYGCVINSYNDFSYIIVIRKILCIDLKFVRQFFWYVDNLKINFRTFYRHFNFTNFMINIVNYYNYNINVFNVLSLISIWYDIMW